MSIKNIQDATLTCIICTHSGYQWEHHWRRELLVLTFQCSLCSANRIVCEFPTFDRKSWAVNLFTVIVNLYPTDVQRTH